MRRPTGAGRQLSRNRCHSSKQVSEKIGALHSVLALVNSNDQVVNTYQYDPFGCIEQANESVSQPLRFTGREYEPETGLYYYRARYYDPELGRFLSEDPIGLAGGINLYAYVGNDPVNARDPYGLYDPGDDLYYYVGSIGLELNATWIRRGYTVPVSTVAYFLNSIGSGPELPAEGCSVGEWYGGAVLLGWERLSTSRVRAR